MQMLVRFSSILLVIIVIVETSFVKLDQNGYENVLIRIADDVSSADCLQTISNLKVMLLEASSALCTAVEGRAYFRNVTILIPNHWAANRNCLVDTNITWPRTHMADLIVTPNHPNFGSQPFTLNYGGCGVSSLPVRLPIGYLTALGKGVAIAHEWFHYRYGVFDEIGVNGDPLYPDGYQITQPEAEILPTSCTNEPLKGEWIGSEWQNSNDNGNITSSIMFSTNFPSINRLCTAENHLKAPPTKQNWLCGSRSVSEIVYSHHDFIENNNTQARNCSQTTFSVATNRHRGYHIILDVTSAMGVDNLTKSATFAASHFVWFLPEGSIVSIDTFSDTYSQLQTPVALNVNTKNTILSHLGELVIKSTANTAGLSLALDYAMQMFRDGSEIILITAAQEVPSNFSVYVDQFRRNLIAPHILALSIQASDIFTPLARDGRLYFVPSRSNTPGVGNSKFGCTRIQNLRDSERF
ncbi:calcium-activated chloride channel regulator 1-like [Daphnia pulex]|uniref:calcium-activated chloride channel regulator 1-like n=1 Tax=Daphnia pulex TaxID=6669 RepID=UPI001EDE1191|nr:calcium-activated chloride channel regulator 1-like [Daphnia pulex]